MAAVATFDVTKRVEAMRARIAAGKKQSELNRATIVALELEPDVPHVFKPDLSEGRLNGILAAMSERRSIERSTISEMVISPKKMPFKFVDRITGCDLPA